MAPYDAFAFKNSLRGLSTVGIVVIGRNEGSRLENCLLTLDKNIPIVYVDSGSTDGSVKFALGLSCNVVELDMTRAFTAARARNVGWRTMASLWPEVQYIQFLDGDCELVPDWLSVAEEILTLRPEAAIVSGRLRERFPERSIFNRLCDFEWDTPIGLTKCCGGIAMIRLSALRAVHGYNDSLIAGEEPEMCLRMRQCHWTIWRLAKEMALHDAAMYRFGQWWARTKRGGFACASTAYLHRGSAESFNVQKVISALIWGLVIPASIFSLALQFGAEFLLLLFIYPVQILRLSFKKNSRTSNAYRFRLIRSVFIVLGKFPEAFGVGSFFFDSLLKRDRSLIEYK
jgi:glycosyltransferase involved in cell wall biosynthesis